jgi:hypothetical protein
MMPVTRAKSSVHTTPRIRASTNPVFQTADPQNPGGDGNPRFRQRDFPQGAANAPGYERSEMES